MGSPFKQWYAIRNRLRKEGKWNPANWKHKVPAQEDGEPDPKKSREDDGADTDPEMPPLEDPPTDEGILIVFVFQYEYIRSSRLYDPRVGREC